MQQTDTQRADRWLTAVSPLFVYDKVPAKCQNLFFNSICLFSVLEPLSIDHLEAVSVQCLNYLSKPHQSNNSLLMVYNVLGTLPYAFNLMFIKLQSFIYYHHNFHSVIIPTGLLFLK